MVCLIGRHLVWSSAVINHQRMMPGPVFQFALAYSVAENAGTITVTVNRVDARAWFRLIMQLQPIGCAAIQLRMVLTLKMA